MKLRQWLLLVGAALGFGGSGLLTRVAFVDGLGAWTQMGIRYLVAAAGAFAVARRLDDGEGPSRAEWRIGSVLGIWNVTVPYAFITYAYAVASAGFVGTFTALIPAATAVFAHRLLPDERLDRGVVAGLAVGLAGVVVLGASGDGGLATGGRPVLAAALATVGIAAIGWSGVYAKRHAGAYRPLVVTGVQFAVAAAAVLPIMAVVEGLPLEVSPRGWLVLGSLGLGGTLLPFVFYYALFRTAAATQVALVGYLVPFVGLVGGVVLLDEVVTLPIALGAALVLAGVFLTDRARRTPPVRSGR